MLKVFGEGRLTKDAEIFHYNTNNGTNTGVRFTIASNRIIEGTDFIDCTFFNRGEKLANALHQGDQVCVVGDLQIDRETDGNNYKVYPKIIIDDLSFGAKKNNSNNNNNYNNNNYGQNGYQENNYQQGNNYRQGQNYNNNNNGGYNGYNR